MKRRTDAVARPLPEACVPWLLAVVLATAAPHALHLPLWLSALAGTLVAWRFRLWRQRRALPPYWSIVLCIVAGSAGIAWEFRTLFGRDAGVALLFLFAALKPLEMRGRRDAFVIVMLGAFLMLTGFFFAQDLLTGAWQLVTSVLLTATLIQLHGGAESPARLLRRAAALLAQALPLMLILFLFFPRVQGPLWGLPRDAHAGMTGLSDRLAPGSLDRLIQSGAIAFRVRFDGEPPPKHQWYWRGPVFADFDGKTWQARAFPTRAEAAAARPVVAAQGMQYRYTLTIEPHNQRWLLALDIPNELPDGAVLTPWFEARTRAPLTQRTRYRFASVPDYAVNREESAGQLRLALNLPPGVNPRARALAAAWREQLRAPAAISEAALRLFRQQPFTYTLQPPLLGENGIDDFLFRTQRGFCEHFATAYVFLMRAAGVPARIVTGYQGGERNPIDDQIVVRQSDAHAWAEIWIAGRGWLRVDPTAAVAPARVEQGIAAALPASDPLPALVRIDADWLRLARYRWEALGNAWNQWVLGYNPERQQQTLARLGLATDRTGMVGWLSLFCTLTLLAVAAGVLHARRRITPPQRLWQRYCARLRRCGIERAPWEGPLALAERVARTRPELGALTREAAMHYADMHYGSAGLGRVEALAGCVRRLEQLTRNSKWRNRN